MRCFASENVGGSGWPRLWAQALPMLGRPPPPPVAPQFAGMVVSGAIRAQMRPSKRQVAALGLGQDSRWWGWSSHDSLLTNPRVGQLWLGWGGGMWGCRQQGPCWRVGMGCDLGPRAPPPPIRPLGARWCHQTGHQRPGGGPRPLQVAQVAQVAQGPECLGGHSLWGLVEGWWGLPWWCGCCVGCVGL